MSILQRLREKRLVRLYHRHKSMGARNTPGVIVRGKAGSFEVVAPPDENGMWTLYTGEKVATRDILKLDTGRMLAGYD